MREVDPSTAYSSVVDPLSVVVVPIIVVMNSGSVAHIVLEVSLIVFAVLEQDLHLAIHNAVAIESALNQLIREREQCTVAHGAAITPLTLVDSASCSEFAKTCSVAHVGLPLALVDVSVGENLLAATLLNALGDNSLVDVVCHSAELSKHFVHQREPVAGHSGFNLFWNAEGLVFFRLCLFLLLDETRFRLVVLVQKLRES